MADTTITGTFKIMDFKIGTVTVAPGLNKIVTDGSLSVYSDPANKTLTVSFETAAGGADVSLSDIVGKTVFSTSAGAGPNKITVHTSGLSSGTYILNIAAENGKVTRKVTIE